MAYCQFVITIKTFLVGRSHHVYYRYCGVDIAVDVVSVVGNQLMDIGQALCDILIKEKSTLIYHYWSIIG